MRIVPAAAPSSSTSHSITYESTAHPLNAVHDSLRHGPSKSAASVQPGTTHALEARLEQWAETQEKLKLGMQRSNFGLGLPLRVMMEKKIVMEVRPLIPRNPLRLFVEDAKPLRDRTTTSHPSPHPNFPSADPQTSHSRSSTERTSRSTYRISWARQHLEAGSVSGIFPLMNVGVCLTFFGLFVFGSSCGGNRYPCSDGT